MQKKKKKGAPKPPPSHIQLQGETVGSLLQNADAPVAATFEVQSLKKVDLLVVVQFDLHIWAMEVMKLFFL